MDPAPVEPAVGHVTSRRLEAVLRPEVTLSIDDVRKILIGAAQAAGVEAAIEEAPTRLLPAS